MAITRFTKSQIQAFHPALKAALEQFAKAHGLTVTLNGGGFDELTYLPKVTFTVATTESGESAERALFDKWSMYFGAETSDYRRTFTVNSTRYTLVGFAPSRTKFPVAGVNAAGTKYFFPREVLAKLDPR